VQRIGRNSGFRVSLLEVPGPNCELLAPVLSSNGRSFDGSWRGGQIEGGVTNALEVRWYQPARGHRGQYRPNHFGDKLGTGLPIQTQPAYNTIEGLKRFSPCEIQGLQRIIDVGATISKCRYSG
jgi:hypothetical protein